MADAAGQDWQGLPAIRAGFVDGDGSDLHRRGVVFQIVIEKGAQHVLAEPCAGVGAEANRAERGGVFDLLAVMPRAEDHEDLVVVGVERLDGLVDGGGAVDVFLVPEAVHQQDRHLDAFAA